MSKPIPHDKPTECSEQPWVDYQPHRQRDKRFYDIKLRDGTIVECCWPNGVHFTPFGFKPVPKKAGLPPYPDYRVIAIRECDNPEMTSV